MSKLNFAAMKCKQRMSPITVVSLLVPVLMMLTTASLSQRHKMDLFCHAGPQIAMAITIGISSFEVMWWSCVLGDH